MIYTRSEYLKRTNERLHCAVAVARIHRDGASMAEVRDAINWRRDVRDYRPAPVSALRSKYEAQIRTYGRIEHQEAAT